jgi:hypothetical protein
VGEKEKDQRRVAVPSLCSWCGLVQVGDAWMEDRRNPNGGRYADRICPECQTDYFLDTLSRVEPRKR